jgi:uncharacterized protein involved in copper resistance
MTLVRPIALAACMALSVASAVTLAQQSPSDPSTSQTNPSTSATAPQSPPSSTMPSTDSTTSQNMTSAQKAAMKSCVADEKAKNDGSTSDQIKQTCKTRLGVTPQG